MGASTLGIISIGSSVLGTGLSFVGQLQQQAAQKAQADYQAAILRNNAIIAEQQAKERIRIGRLEEERSRLDTKALQSKQTVALAGSGQVVGQGSAADIIESTALIGEEDALIIRDQAAREARAMRLRGQGFEADARLAEASGRSSIFGPIGTLLTGAGSVAQKWYAFKKEDQNFGVFNA